MGDSNFRQKLLQLQCTIKAPKGQYNAFGKYNYRSCEDIQEAAKPICLDLGLLIYVSDKVDKIGDRYYVVALATVEDVETGETKSCTACAREQDTKKGMDESQITGSASSYARKYALAGLLQLDDTKDADTQKPPEKQETQYHCTVCGKKIEPMRDKNGKIWKPEELAKAYHGMCVDCYKEAQK